MRYTVRYHKSGLLFGTTFGALFGALSDLARLPKSCRPKFGHLKLGVGALLLGLGLSAAPIADAGAQQTSNEAPDRNIADRGAVDRGAVVLMYHRFDEPEHPETNIRLDQFEQHIAELKSDGYTVLALPEILEKLRNRETLPDRTVAITVNDATTSLYEHGWPRLKAAGFPFTVFVATDFIDRQAFDSIGWDKIREMAEAGVTIGSQTASLAHLPEIELDRLKLELDRAANRIETEIGTRPNLIAYPYGEYGIEIQKIVADRGYLAAFGQQSGVLHAGSDRFGLPRFVLNEAYGDIDRFRLVSNAMPLPVSDRVPVDLVLKQNPPAFGFTVMPNLGSSELLDCYASGVGRTRVERLGDRIEVRLPAPFPPGRSRINCTMPGPDDRWRWYGVQFFIPG